MIKKTLSIFEEVLLDSVLLEFAGVPSEEDIEYSFTTDFERKSEKLIRKSRSRYWHHVNTTAKKLLIAAIITALLVSSAMAIPSVREEVMKIFVHDTGINYYFTVDEEAVNNAPKEIELVYTLSYIPAGFAQSNSTFCSDFVSYEYLSPDGEFIGFKQETMPDDPAEDVGPYIDSEESKVEYIELNGYKVIQIVFGEPGDEAVAFLWTNEDYFFTLYCTAYEKIDIARHMLISIEPSEQLTDAVLADRDAD